MANITRGVFSEIPNFEMYEESMAKHTTLISNLTGKSDANRPSKAERDKAENMTIRVWKSMLQVKPEASEMASLYLMPLEGRADKKTLMACVDEVFRGLDLSKMKEYFLTATEKWDDMLNDYLEEVETLIKDEIVQGVVAKGRPSEVAQSVGAHFAWVRFNHQNLYHHGRMPLLSPSVVRTTIEVFNGIGEGITEVRISIDR
jgi:hypothetical protein